MWYVADDQVRLNVINQQQTVVVELPEVEFIISRQVQDARHDFLL
jgi:hypothetical protein